MNKKGQVTLFVIIAIVIVVLGVSLFVFKDKIFTKTSSIQTQEVSTYVIDCIEKSLFSAVYEVAETGGYYIPSKDSTDSGIPYYLINNQNKVPSITQIEYEISENLEFLISSCVSNSSFSDLNVIFGKPEVLSEIKEDRIFFSVNYPLNITKEENTYFLEDFGTFEKDIELKKLYDLSQRIILSILQENSFCISCFSDFALENDVSINFENPYEDTFIFSLKEKTQEKIPLNFKFAVEYEN